MKLIDRIALALCLIVASALAVQSAAAQENFVKLRDVETFTSVLAGRTSAVESIQASVRQEKYLSVFKAKVVSTGSFAWQKPDRLCLDYKTPSAYKIVIDGDRLLTINAGRSSSASLKGNPVMSQMRSLMAACMTGDLSLMGGGFSMEYFESPSEYRVEIVPQSEQIRGYIARMVICLDRKDLSVNSLLMYENETDYTGYTFYDKKFNQKIPDSVFAAR